MGSQKGQKNMAIEELKQIWNSVVAVAVDVASVTIAILKE